MDSCPGGESSEERRAFLVFRQKSESKQESFKIKARYFPGTGNTSTYVIVGVNHGIVWHFWAILIHSCYQTLPVEFRIYYPHLTRVSSLSDEGHGQRCSAC